MIGIIISLWQCYAYVFAGRGIDADQVEVMLLAVFIEILLEFLVIGVLAETKPWVAK
jgi:hypothetical protein